MLLLRYKIVFNYIWENKTELIKRDSICMPIKKGGLGLLDVETQSRSLKIKQVNALLQPYLSCPYKFFALYWTRHRLATSLPKHFPYLVDNTKPTANFNDIPPYYQSTLHKIRTVAEVREAFNNTTYREPDLLTGEKDATVILSLPMIKIYRFIVTHVNALSAKTILTSTSNGKILGSFLSQLYA